MQGVSSSLASDPYALRQVFALQQQRALLSATGLFGAASGALPIGTDAFSVGDATLLSSLASSGNLDVLGKLYDEASFNDDLASYVAEQAGFGGAGPDLAGGLLDLYA
jgi:hypothetical protein